jgi:inosine-uridine nucleoside N-ribohydrolase
MKGRPVWIDTDLAIGMFAPETGFADVDDAYAILHLMRARQVAIRGISSVFGNTTLEHATRLSHEIVQRFDEENLPVYTGAGKKLDLSDLNESEATKALAEALRSERLTIMAIGPATNIATLLLLHPECASQIESVVLVAGRRSPEQHFCVGPAHSPPFPDLNFDLDPDAFRILLQHDVPVVLLPFEISHKVWIDKADLDQLALRGEAGAYLAEGSRNWLSQWASFGCEAFNPFDVLASGYILYPELFAYEDLPARIEIHPDDTSVTDAAAFKPYLLLSQDKPGIRNVRYCHTAAPEFKQKLWDDLAG